ncbi:MAG: DUF4126 family protein [Acidobacteriota bacterium]|nr:DUF4126 family protein [Acidobacteriota bacterium]
MATAVLTWLVAIPVLGAVTGLRTMTAMAVLCWFAYSGNLDVQDTWAFWTGKLVTPIVFTLLALGELYADKMPWVPNRIDPGPLFARVCFGGLIGAIIGAVLGRSSVEGLILGVIGAIIGAFTGFVVRREVVQRLRCNDWPVAAAEDLVAIGCAIWAMGIITN